MADQLAFGAVRSLLGLLQEEGEQLIRVGDDVRFIQEEMESMESFLEHLAGMMPASGEHEPPVRTWMKQVRDLAFDCSNCVDLYLRRGRGAARDDPNGCLVGLLRSMPFSLSLFTALLAQRDAAAKIRQLKARVLEVGERRQRYGVELPRIDSAVAGDVKDKDGAAPSIEKVVSDDDDTIREKLGFSEPNVLQNCTKQLVEWLIRVAAPPCPPPLPLPLPLPPVDHEVIVIAPTPPPSVDHEVINTKAPPPPVDHEVIGVEKAPTTPPPPVDNVIGIVAPDKDEDGHELVRNAFEDPKVRRDGQARLYEKVIFIPMPFGESLDLLKFYRQTNPDEALWVVLRFILNHLVPLPPQTRTDEVFARDYWDMAQIAEEITNRKELKGARVLFVISCWSGMGQYWHLMEKALGTFGCAEGSAVIVIMSARDDSNELIIKGSKNNRQIITYSLVEHFSEKVQLLVLPGTLYTRDDYPVSNIWSILQEIQDRCEPRAFCLKMFVHYLYGKHRTKEQLLELLNKTLAVIPANSDVDVAAEIRETNGKRLLNFCYADLPRSFRSCLLYLAIFPPGRKIWRSRLVMRWIVEGLIAGRDMRRAMLRAERCFDTLVNRWFVCPEDIGDWGKVKSCTVPHKLVQELIQDGAKEEQFLDPRLSSHLAQHFSVHGDLQLRRSDNIEKFMLQLGKKCYKSAAYSQAQLNLIKVLDLEGIQADADLNKNQSRYLKNVCNNLLLLKYLSIRNTNINRLPKEINNLEHLEILDIRQTRVSSDSTKDIILPKLKCLLAGHTRTSNDDGTTTTGAADKSFPSVQIPRNISMMPNMEVLSHVNTSKYTVDIGKLWRLRKLGVVIDDDLGKWLKAISDLNECLLSLSILIKCQADNQIHVQLHAKLLQRLSIRGATSGQLLPLFLKGDNGRHIAKLTLRDTQASFLNEHLKSLPSLKCLKLKYGSYLESKLILKKNMVPKLEFLIVKCSKITSINFHSEAAPRLEKIVWSFTEMESLTGTKNLASLKVIELNANGNIVPAKVREEVAQHLNPPLLLIK